MVETIHALEKARQLSWQEFGKKITFYLPGMFNYNNMTGRYPAISITGEQCSLMCDHCQGEILKSMVQASKPELLIERCQTLEKKGVVGVLISGGCDYNGQLPWNDFLDAVKTIKQTTNLMVSVHSGLISESSAIEMKEAGVDQALIDVIGDEDTFLKVYHLSKGIDKIEKSMGALVNASIELIPHIVCGLDYGRIKGEENAVSIVSNFDVEKLVFVSLMGIPGTPMFKVKPPKAENVATIIANARFKMPKTKISLGCARERGNSLLDVLAIKAGVNSMALPSDEAVIQAEKYNLDIRYQKTCCSVSVDLSSSHWK